jgi:hypothetical protein
MNENNSIADILNESVGETMWASSLITTKNDPFRSSAKKLARKRVRDEWARCRKMYFGLDDVTALPDGSVFVTNSFDMILGKEEEKKTWHLVETGSDNEARCKRAEHLRGLLTSLFIDGTVTRGGVEHLVVSITRPYNVTNEDYDGIITLFTEAAYIAGFKEITQSTYGRIRIRVQRCKIHSRRMKKVYPVMCPIIHRAQLNDMARMSYDVKLITEKGKKQREAAEQKGKKKTKCKKALGPRDFPRWITISTSYTNSECYGMRLPDGSYYEPTQNQQVFMTWEEYEARKELKVKYRVDFRIKKSKKRKSKGGGASGGKAFTGKSESVVVKRASRHM